MCTGVALLFWGFGDREVVEILCKTFKSVAKTGYSRTDFGVNPVLILWALEEDGSLREVMGLPLVSFRSRGGDASSPKMRTVGSVFKPARIQRRTSVENVGVRVISMIVCLQAGRRRKLWPRDRRDSFR